MKKKLVSILLAVATVAGTCGAPTMAVLLRKAPRPLPRPKPLRMQKKKTPMRQTLKMRMPRTQTRKTMMRTMFPMSIPPLLLKSIIPSWVSSTACTAKQKRRPTFPRDMP